MSDRLIEAGHRLAKIQGLTQREHQLAWQAREAAESTTRAYGDLVRLLEENAEARTRQQEAARDS